ncbi:GTPase [uncultured Winogradskyella sp.]|uniref:GTPase n=1 Tax=uncultured Winogradskyella sp. TaxID=395353 RepID=UPI00261A4983|nr:GTPase [uncultured Winogradskyella sp.]
MTLIFVYNANSGKLNALFDAGHKLFSPSTYKCSLCALTYNTLTERTLWKEFRTKSKLTMEFYHKDEFETKFPNIKLIYPTVVKLKDNTITTVITSGLLNRIDSTEMLIRTLDTKLKAI